ncbi:MAG: hypothetical protein U9R57_17225 [Thermodesulfobacteriota bacterium]|nr:hypothetical protein [Thermodesulfobacteriota bacterium]
MPSYFLPNPYANSKTDVITRVSDFNDGLRIRHWTDKNSVKLYNEQNVLRIETTINDPTKFKVFRHKQGQSSDEPKQRLPLRKGVMDIPLRAVISQVSTIASLMILQPCMINHQLANVLRI